MERTYSHIDMDERRKIARWRMAGISVDHVAAKLGRHRSTIFRAVKRNTFVDPQMPDLNGYYCVTAQDMARDRRGVGKLFRREDLRTAVIGKLGAGWSPEQIAGRLKIEPKAKAAFVTRPSTDMSMFCDPSAPWQKGTFENMNRRIRRYLPQETAVLSVPDESIRSMIDQLNHTPRKCLGFQTPAEVFRREVIK